MEYSLGSTWRKWDLQVQTRIDEGYTCLGNSLTPDQNKRLSVLTGLTEAQITSQEKLLSDIEYAKLFVNYILEYTDISAIAITDHNSGESIDSILEEANQSDGRLVVFPGVEISSNHGIHILCIFDPDNKWKTSWSESISHFLTELGISNPFNAEKQPVSSSLSSQEILEKVSSHGGISVFAHVATERGLFYRSSTANGGTTHSDIYKHNLCNIVQIPSVGKVPSGVVNILAGKEPQYGNKSVTQIKCSDARKISDIGSSFVWIKADPTLKGLKQIIYEPEDRVSLSEANPYSEHSKIYLDSLVLSGSANYVLPDFKQGLNRDLVTVIGGRGSGKSALLETVAFINEEHLKIDQNGKKKVVEYYRENEGKVDPAPTFTLSAIVTDKDEAQSHYTKDLSERNNLGLPFLYLGQERLNSVSTNDVELTRIICELIGIDIGSSVIESLVEVANRVLQEEQLLAKKLEATTNKYLELGYEHGSQTLKSWIADYLKTLIEQQRKLSSETTKAALTTINEKVKRGIGLKSLKSKATELLSSINTSNINDSIHRFTVNVKEYYPQFLAINRIDTAEQQQQIERLEKDIDKELAELREQIQEIKNSLVVQGIREDVNSLLQASENIQRKISGIEADSLELTEIEERFQELIKVKHTILSQITEKLEIEKKMINDSYLAFKESRSDSSSDEKELFERIMSDIDVEGEIVFDFKKLATKILSNYIDKRIISNQQELKREIAGSNDEGVPNSVTFSNLSSWIIRLGETNERYISKSNLVRLQQYVLTEWKEFYWVKTIVKLKGKPSDILSLGQRGTLLLKVYLATASVKQIIIIDQPEDNLDNNFIVKELIPLIRQVKKSRLIILSTHNANIVVNADSEQVIIARLDQGMNYYSGSIENPRVNTYIKNILEGGELAFQEREKKYSL